MTKARELAELGKAVSVHDNRLDFDRAVVIPGLIDAAGTTTIADGSVTTAKIADDAVTSAKVDTNIAVGGTLNVTGETTLATHLNLGDNDKIKLGAGADLQLSHSGTNSVIDNNTGGLYIRNNVASDVGGDIFIQAKSGENSATFTHDGAVTLMHDNATKFATTSTGATVSSSADVTMNITAGGTSNDSLINFVHGSTTDGGITYDHNGAYASEKMVFRTGNNTPHMYLDGNGKLGIGGTPSVPLHIQASSQDAQVRIQALTNGYATRLQLYANNVSGASYNAIQSHVNGDSTVQWEISGPKASAEDQMLFSTGGTERMRIKASGVGVGTTAPTAPLHVISGEIGNGSNKGIKISNHNASKVYSIRTGITGSENTSLSIHDDTAGVNRIAIDTSGRVGIGTYSMGAYHANNDDLVISTSGSTGITIASGTADQGRIAFADGTGDNAEEMRGLIMYNHNGNVMSFFTNSAERMRITDSGLVGINQSNPYSVLSAENNTSATTTITASSQIVNNTNYHDFALANRESYAVGIRRTLTQSTPSYLRPRMDFFVQHYNTYLPADRSIKMTIKDTGKVGIATVTPDEGSMMTIVHPGSSVYGLRFESSQTSGTQYHFTVYRGSTHAGYMTSNASNQIALYNGSDERLKKNIVNSDTATQSIKNLKVRKFDWKDDSLNGVDFGFVAQELFTEAPEAVMEGTDEKDDNGNYKQPWSVSYNNLVPRLVKTIQELEARITELENK